MTSRLDIATICLATVLTTATAIAQTRGSDAASSSPATQNKGGFFKSIGSHLHDVFHPGTSQSFAAPTAAVPAATPADAMQASMPPGVIDITTIPGVSETVTDSECKTLVQPFNLTGNMASLGWVYIKLKTEGIFNSGSQETAKSTRGLVRRAAFQLNWLPKTAEVQLGQRLLGREHALLNESQGRAARQARANAQQTLDRVLAAAGTSLPYDFSIHVLREAGTNATSLPGGVILVDEALVGRNWDPDLAFFKVAHEVSHVLQRHQTRMYQARLADGVNSFDDLRKLLHVGGNGNNPGNELSMVLNQASAFQTLGLNFSSGQELQADACAVRMMHAQYPTPGGFNAVIGKVEASFGPVMSDATAARAQKNWGEVIVKLGKGPYERHPTTSERLSNLRRMAMRSS